MDLPCNSPVFSSVFESMGKLRKKRYCFGAHEFCCSHACEVYLNDLHALAFNSEEAVDLVGAS